MAKSHPGHPGVQRPQPVPPDGSKPAPKKPRPVPLPVYRDPQKRKA
jgi:hypothetical protein